MALLRMCGTTLLLMTASVYPVYCACFCHLLETQHCCPCPNRSCNSPPAVHPLPPPIPPTFIHVTRDNTVAVKRVAQNPAVLPI